MNVLTLIALTLMSIIALAVLAVIVWLVVRPGPSAGVPRARQTEVPAAAVEPAEATSSETSEDRFEVTEAPRGPHPRPPELDREARRELRLLDERLHRRFFEQAGIPPDEWARLADSLLIVHDRMPVGIALEHFEEATGTHVAAPQVTQLSPRQVIATVNQQLSPERRLLLLGTLEEPLEADVYGPAGTS